MEWYRLRARVVNIRCIMCSWVCGCRIIFHDKDGVVSTGIDRSIWVTKVKIVIWCWTESAGKVIVSPWSGV